MYRNCIFCSADFGSNDVVEHFPVGRQLAFDGWRGRLWAVCPVCARWNLAPIEERWEAVGAADKLFRDSRLRVQSENVGLAKLADGTRLIRVGSAVPGEMAAWRYGTQLLRRRKRYLAVTGLTALGGLAAYGGAAALGFGTGMAWMAFGGFRRRRRQQVIHQVPASATGAQPVTLRRWHVHHIDLLPPESGDDLRVLVRDARLEKPGRIMTRSERAGRTDVTLSGDAAHAVLGRAMVHVNRTGATEDTLRQADRILADAGEARRVLLDAARRNASLSDKAAYHARALQGPAALAVEMALHEESERRALEGELAALQAAWKEAEEIAAIADALPGEAALNRMLDRLIR